jgi:transposase
VGKLIETRLGVRLSQTRVWQILRTLRWSCQRPVGKARERDEAAIRRWKRRDWPRIKKTLPPKAAPSSLWTSPV